MGANSSDIDEEVMKNFEYGVYSNVLEVFDAQVL